MVPKPAWIDPVCSSAIDVSRVFFVFFFSGLVNGRRVVFWPLVRSRVSIFFVFSRFSPQFFRGILVMALKFDGLVEPYTGREGTEDWDDFWQKFLVLADISG